MFSDPPGKEKIFFHDDPPCDADLVAGWCPKCGFIPDMQSLGIRYEAVAETAQGRFHQRIARYRREGVSALLHHLWWFTHNCIAHPLIGVLPVRWTFAFHDYTSERINKP